MSSRIAYFINQYPKVSHSFIRWEILALERLGFDILRNALRGWKTEVVDKEDEREQPRTRYVLYAGLPPLLFAMLRVLVTSPGRFFSAFALAIRKGRRAAFVSARFWRHTSPIGTQHQEVVLTEQHFIAQLDAALDSLDQPTFDGLNSYYMSHAVREAGFKVALVGTGGDEMFGGYTSFRDLLTLFR